MKTGDREAEQEAKEEKLPVYVFLEEERFIWAWKSLKQFASPAETLERMHGDIWRLHFGKPFYLVADGVLEVAEKDSNSVIDFEELLRIVEI